MVEGELFGRYLKVYTEGDFNVDFSDLHCKISIQNTDTTRPYACDVRVYNIKRSTCSGIKCGDTLTVDAGYNNLHGVIFVGKVVQVRYGRVGGVNTYLDIRCMTNENLITKPVYKTLSKESTRKVVLDEIGNRAEIFLKTGLVPSLNDKYPRGKTVVGNTLKFYKNIGFTMDATFVFENNTYTIFDLDKLELAETVILSSKTGLIGRPQLTLQGITGRCLINPNIKVGVCVKIAQESIDDYLVPTQYAKSIPPVPEYDLNGLYWILQTNYELDNRGLEWYINFTAVASNTSRSVVGKAFALQNGG